MEILISIARLAMLAGLAMARDASILAAIGILKFVTKYISISTWKGAFAVVACSLTFAEGVLFFVPRAHRFSFPIIMNGLFSLYHSFSSFMLVCEGAKKRKKMCEYMEYAEKSWSLFYLVLFFAMWRYRHKKTPKTAAAGNLRPPSTPAQSLDSIQVDSPPQPQTTVRVDSPSTGNDSPNPPPPGSPNSRKDSPPPRIPQPPRVDSSPPRISQPPRIDSPPPPKDAVPTSEAVADAEPTVSPPPQGNSDSSAVATPQPQTTVRVDSPSPGSPNSRKDSPPRVDSPPPRIPQPPRVDSSPPGSPNSRRDSTPQPHISLRVNSVASTQVRWEMDPTITKWDSFDIFVTTLI